MKLQLHCCYKRVGLSMVLLAGSLVFQSAAQGQTAEALMDALVRKGILTQQEAEDIKVDLARENAEANKLRPPEKSTSQIKLYGDFRGRFEGFWSENDAWTTRQRWRYRTRLGVRASLTDNFEAGVRLGSGDLDGGIGTGIDPISQNQSFQNNGSKKGIFVDLAYGKWHTDPLELKYQGSVTFGKMENPFVFSTLVFDKDYTPEGIGSEWTYNVNLEHALSFNAGAFVLDEIGGSTHDPYLLGAQVRYDSIWAYNEAHKPKIQTSFGAAVLGIGHKEQLANGAVPNINVGNTRGADGAPEANFNPIAADASLTFWVDQAPFYNGLFPVRVGADYIYNPAASGNNQGIAAGITLGKAGKKATWELGYEYRFLESDAWFEEFVDSDFGGFYGAALPNSGQGSGYRSGTNVRGHIVRLSYSPYNALTLGLTWFNARPIDVPVGSDGPATIQRLIVDAVVKF